jgi:hypothetical protein
MHAMHHALVIPMHLNATVAIVLRSMIRFVYLPAMVIPYDIRAHVMPNAPDLMHTFRAIQVAFVRRNMTPFALY